MNVFCADGIFIKIMWIIKRKEKKALRDDECVSEHEM